MTSWCLSTRERTREWRAAVARGADADEADGSLGDGMLAAAVRDGRASYMPEHVAAPGGGGGGGGAPGFTGALERLRR